MQPNSSIDGEVLSQRVLPTSASLVPFRPLGMNLCVRGDDALCFELRDLLVRIVEQAAQHAIRVLAQ